MKSFYERAWEVVRQVPRGKVVTYGQVARWLHSPRASRAVGYAMFNLDEPHRDVPWHRVINSRGEISRGGHAERPQVQRAMLEAEGIELDRGGRVDLARYRWDGAGLREPGSEA